MLRNLTWSLAMVLLVVAVHSIALGQARPNVAGNSLPDAAQPAVTAPAPARETPATPPRRLSDAEHQQFAQRIDLNQFRRLAVFDRGRTKIMDTLAREEIDRIYGKRRWKDLTNGATYDPVFTYLDLMFNPVWYAQKPLVYVEVLELRRALVAGLDETDQEQWLRWGRLSPARIWTREAGEILAGMDGDLLRQKGVRQVQVAWSTFRRIGQPLEMVSPRAGESQWADVADLAEAADTRTAATGGDAVAIAAGAAVADPQVATQVVEQFRQLESAWRAADAAGVNVALAALTQSIPRLNPATYPSGFIRELEMLYNLTHKFTVGYVAYFLATIVLLIAFAAQRPWLIRGGVGLLLLGLLIHTAGMLVRGLIAGRWPIHNQFESYFAISWMSVLVGVLLMAWARQWLYGAAAAALGAAALLFANTVDIPSREVGQVAGILATSRILYVHVNMVLASYGLIALAFFVSLFYLGIHYAQGRGLLRLAAAGLGRLTNTPVPATAGGAGADTQAPDPGEPGRQALLRDMDRAQMVLVQLAFWILGVGVLLGAYWADHAWGRWWAWDPKETWALITWIIYLMVIHLRFAVKNRGLVTAWMSVVGFCVMLWCYWGVNLLLAGLHSYA